MTGVIDPVTGKPRLLAEQCRTCVGRPGNLMDLRPGRLKNLIAGNTGPDALGLICHETYEFDDDDQPTGDEQAFCRWFWENYRHLANYQRICERLGGFTEVPPPGGTR
jgi:hypothetical protein